jgi:hypothetical protein
MEGKTTMAQYVKAIAEDLARHLDWSKESEGRASRFAVLLEELNRLDPRDFLPADRFPFVSVRRQVRAFAGLNENEWNYVFQHAQANLQIPTRDVLSFLSRLELTEELGVWSSGKSGTNMVLAQGILKSAAKVLSRLAATLDHHLGPEFCAKSREFTFIRDTALRRIVERDYSELTLKLFPNESWKSVVILAGSILEALLHDLLTRDATRISQAMGAGRAPLRGRGYPPGKRNIQSDAREDQWLLNDCIEVADELTLLPPGWKAGVQAVLREFRNYVHPRKELKAQDPITQGEAFQAVGALMRICDHIEKRHP